MLENCVDVHAHLTHPDFQADMEQVVQNAREAGLNKIVVNGLDTTSNRQTLELAQKFDIVEAALGIYPVYAVHPKLPADFPLKIEPFDIAAEIAFIDEAAKAGRCVAIGECGLDGYWPPEELDSAQEEVFEKLIDISMRHDLPIIVHSRKREARCLEILQALGARKVVFHCFMGKFKIARAGAEAGYHFSIPATAHSSTGFQKMLKELPLEQLLTETDCPYLSPVRNTRNEPANVVNTVKLLANFKSLSEEQAALKIWSNYKLLFGA
jgi:TatD DNase family protein